VAPDQQSSPVPDFPAKEEGDWIPWFPVIDRDRCVNCRQCVEFCLFGTYATDTDGKVRVVHPEKCKTNCPACARVCPYTAIIFPKFTDGPISGDEGRLSGSAESGVAGDMGGLSKANIQTLLKRRDAARAAAGGPAQGDAPASSRSRLGTAPASCDAPAPTSPFNPQSAIHNPQSPEEPPAR
jgi:NAD-dependent dihydropyrimidine dehydrogenase PreA subunit